MLNQNLISQEYDFLGDFIFADNSTVSLPPRRVQQCWNRYITDYVHDYDAHYPDYFLNKLLPARQQLASLFRVSSDEIAFTHSASDSMTILANSLGLTNGDNVIITSEEHPSNAIPWLALERFGVEVRVVESHNGIVTPAELLAAADAHTRVIAVASVFFCSGYAIDLKTLGAECRQRNILLAVDATQSVGRLAIHPRELGIDYMAGGGHKGLLGTKSIGFAYCSKELLQKLTPYTGSLQGTLNAGRPCSLKHFDEIQWSETASKLESGNYPFAAIEAMGLGVSLINELGIENIEQQIRTTEAALRQKLAALPLRTNQLPTENQSGLVFVYFSPKASAEQVQSILLAHKIRAVVRYDYIRIGLHFMNSPAQMEQFAQALAEISKL